MKEIRKWVNKHRLHIIVWAIFIAYECIVVRFFNGVNGAFLAYLFHYTIVIITFYTHANILLPWALKNRLSAIWKLPLIILVQVAGYCVVYYLADLFLQSIHVRLLDKPAWSEEYFAFNIYRAVYFLGFSTAYYYIENYVKQRKKTEELEKEHLKEVIKRQKIEQELTHAQNAFLKAQINPHFLFNTLDFVYHNVTELSPRAADAIITLSEMMRYAIDADKMGEYISIGDEIEQVQNLQYLNRLRKDEDMPLKLIYSDEVRGISFIPLVLLTLTENIFKHGNLHNGQEATMEIYIDKGLFIIKTDNVSNRQKPNTSHRTGLIKIEKRLKYAYGDDTYFNYHQDADGHFRLAIQVPVRQLQGVYATSPVFAGTGTI